MARRTGREVGVACALSKARLPLLAGLLLALGGACGGPEPTGSGPLGAKTESHTCVSILTEPYADAGDVSEGVIRSIDLERGLESLAVPRIRTVVACGAAVVPDLVDILREGPAEAEADAIVCLGLLGANAEPARQELAILLNDIERPYLSGLAAMALASIAPRDARVRAQLTERLEKGSLGYHHLWGAGLLQVGDARLYSVLTSVVKDARQGMRGRDNREEAAWALGRFGKAAQEAVPALASYLEGEGGNHCAMALARIGTPEAVHALVDVALAHRDHNGAQVAAWGLLVLGREAAGTVNRLGPLLRSRNPVVRARIVNVLRQVGAEAEALVPDLIRLATTDPCRGVRANALEAILATGVRDNTVTQVLTQLAQSDDARVRTMARDALAGR